MGMGGQWPLVRSGRRCDLAMPAAAAPSPPPPLPGRWPALTADAHASVEGLGAGQVGCAPFNLRVGEVGEGWWARPHTSYYRPPGVRSAQRAGGRGAARQLAPGSWQQHSTRPGPARVPVPGTLPPPARPPRHPHLASRAGVAFGGRATPARARACGLECGAPRRLRHRLRHHLLGLPLVV